MNTAKALAIPRLCVIMAMMVTLSGCYARPYYVHPPEGAKVVGSFLKGSFWKSNLKVWIMAVDDHAVRNPTETAKTPIVASYGRHVFDVHAVTDTLLVHTKVEIDLKPGITYVIKATWDNNPRIIYVEEMKE